MSRRLRNAWTVVAVFALLAGALFGYSLADAHFWFKLPTAVFTVFGTAVLVVTLRKVSAEDVHREVVE